MMPLRRYVSSSEGMLEKGATRTMPAKVVEFRCIAVKTAESPLSKGWVSVSPCLGGCGSNAFVGSTNLRPTALAIAVPRLWPRITIFSGGIFATSTIQLRRATPSVINPCSVGEPVECPKPR